MDNELGPITRRNVHSCFAITAIYAGEALGPGVRRSANIDIGAKYRCSDK